MHTSRSIAVAALAGALCLAPAPPAPAACRPGEPLWSYDTGG